MDTNRRGFLRALAIAPAAVVAAKVLPEKKSKIVCLTYWMGNLYAGREDGTIEIVNDRIREYESRMINHLLPVA